MFLPKTTLTLTCLLFIFAAQSQTLQDSLDLRRDLDTYLRVSKKMDYDSILNFMPPKLYTLVPKNRMKEDMKNSIENDDFTMGFDTFAYKSVLPLVQIGNQICTMVTYDLVVSMTYSDDQDSSFIKIMTNVFVEQYGAENVGINPQNTNALKIKVLDKKMFALKEPEWDSWKLFEDKRADAPQSEELMKTVIEQEVLDYFK